MKQTNFQLILVIFMFFPLAFLPATQANLILSSSSEHLDQLIKLPVTDEASQKIYLVRHGESTANVYFEMDGKKVRKVSGHSPSIPLTEKGKTQILELAKKLAARFAKETPLTITSSSALRTQETAKILFTELSKTHSNIFLVEEFYAGLNERHLGEWEGLIKNDSYAKAESPWRAISAAEKFFSAEVEGGESYSEVASRAIVDLTKIYNSYLKNTVIAITSFNTINAVAIQMNPLSNSLSTIPGSSLPKLELDNGDLVLLEMPRNCDIKNTPRVTSHIKFEN